MKKTSLLISFALSGGILFGQSQRLVFIEEFTQASCGPCASANPTFNTLLSANTAKATSLKYQVSWPGTDPMYNQNTADCGKRVSYYGVTGVPDALQDGVDKSSPGNVIQAGIDAEYAVASPFVIVLKHWFNAANDSIFINCDITCSQNVTMTTPKLQIAMMEKTITFTTAPGSNGEKVFYNVMRKMYPTANGTSLATAWTNGQKKTISFKAAIPSYIYKKTEIATVAWIQDDADKSVKQSAFSPTASTPLALAPISDFSADVTTSCDGIINFKDNSALFPTSWSWDFGDGTNSNLQNPTHKYNSNGTYTVKLVATNTNGNDVATKTAYVTVTTVGAAPTGVSKKRCGPGVVNLSATASGSGTLNWYNSTGTLVNTGTTYSPTINGTTNFYVSEMTTNAVGSVGQPDSALGAGSTYTATAAHGEYFDVLKPCKLVSVKTYASTAGNRIISVVNALGVTVQSYTVNIPVGLSTVSLNFSLAAGTGYWIGIPSGTTNLYRNSGGATYPYTSNVINITGNDASAGYYYYFYDWKVQQNPCGSESAVVSGIDSCAVTNVGDIATNNFLGIFPNPNSGMFTAKFQTTNTDNYVVKITNTLGQIVYQESLNNFSGTYSKQLDIATYGKGIYMFSITNSKNQDMKKVIIH